jgi:hypothetical protein
MGKVPVVFGSDEIWPETAGHNIKYLMDHWDSIWPVMETALLKEMREYDGEDYVHDAKPALGVSLPKRLWSEPAEWWIVLEFKPFKGVWTVEMVGSQKVKDVAVAF